MQSCLDEDAAPEERIHLYITCDGCGLHPLIGSVMKCSACEDFDLCGTCYSQKTQLGHPDDHAFCARFGDMSIATYQASVALLSRLLASAREVDMTRKLRMPPAFCARGLASFGWLIVLSPFRRAQAACIGATLGASLAAARWRHDRVQITLFDCLLLSITTWVVPLLCALFEALREQFAYGFKKQVWLDLWRYELLPLGTMQISPNQLYYSTDLVALEPVRGRLVYEPRSTYSLVAFFHRGKLTTTDNDVLYSAKYNKAAYIDVLVIKPPSVQYDWQSFSTVKVEYDLASLAFKNNFSSLLAMVEDLVGDPVLNIHDPDVVARKLLLHYEIGFFVMIEFVPLAIWLKKHLFDIFAECKAMESRARKPVECQDESSFMNCMEHFVMNEFCCALSVEAQEHLLQSDYLKLRCFVNFMKEQEPPCVDGLCALQLPVAELTQNTSPSGHVVLEADGIVNASRNETLYDLIKARLPNLDIVQPEGERSYARVQASIADETLVREIIKALARERGKRSNVKAVERVFISPRD